ncbi:MAG: hypothetical protein ACYC2Z_03405 [Candidatus Nanopelagicales bacterium]
MNSAGDTSVWPSSSGSVGVVTVATNRYLDYWFEMARSAEEYLFAGHPVVMHVFTDRPEDAKAMAGDFDRITVNPVPIATLGWPEATLLRYELFDAHHDELGQDLLMHLDADMLLVDDVGAELDPASWPGGIALVRHPGFRRPETSARLALYASHPRMAAGDAVMRVQKGGIGSWESREISRAYVPRRARRRYVCGGTWLGLRGPFLAMVHELATRTRADLDEGTIAIWHDESHLNWFASGNPTALLGSQYCFALGYPNLRDLAPRIVAVDKADDRTR